MTGKLDTHLREIDHAANEMFAQLTKQMAAAEGITEKLKANDQMEWVRRTNSIRKRAREIVDSELIYNGTNPEYRTKTAVCVPGSVYPPMVRYRSNKQRICWCKSNLTGNFPVTLILSFTCVQSPQESHNPRSDAACVRCVVNLPFTILLEPLLSSTCSRRTFLPVTL